VDPRTDSHKLFQSAIGLAFETGRNPVFRGTGEPSGLTAVMASRGPRPICPSKPSAVAIAPGSDLG